MNTCKRHLVKFLVGLVVVGVLLATTIASAADGDIPPDPIDPTRGEQILLDLINSLPLSDINVALDHFPVPFVVVASAGGAEPTVVSQRAGAPTRVDADRSKATGQGGSGQDLIVEVNTELLPTPHLVLNIERLGDAPFADDLAVLIAFPFDAFNAEMLPAPPNLFFGFETMGNYDDINNVYPAGGHAPEAVQIRFIPNVLGGADHFFELEIDNIAPSNPIRYIAGHFDGTADSGIQNALAFSALTDPAPANISLGFDIGNTDLFQLNFQTSFDLTWQASEPSKVQFDYIENETFPFEVSDFGTSITFENMPTLEHIVFSMDTATAMTTLDHGANAVIDELTLRHRRKDELTVYGTATDVPTEMSLTTDLRGTVILDVNANTLDMDLKMVETEGFFDTDDFLGYDLEYIGLRMENVPDLAGGYNPATDSFSVVATNPGECAGCEAIDLFELVLDDDGRLQDGEVLNLQLPTSWDDDTHDIFSLIDDGVHGTAAARVLHLMNATYVLNAASIGESYALQTSEAAPMQAYVRTSGTTKLIENRDVEVTCDVDDFPAGILVFDFDFPDQLEYTIDPPQDIESVHCYGYIDDLQFDVTGGELPPRFTWDFDPDDHLNVIAEDGLAPNSARLGLFAVRLWDEVGVEGIPDSDALFDVPLMDARARVDDVPSFQSTWSDAETGTSVDFDTGDPAADHLYLLGAQVSVSTLVELTDELPGAYPTSRHYARYVDEGEGNPKRFAVGVFGIDEFNYISTESDEARELTMQYLANAPHGLTLDVDSVFGGHFFPDYAIDARLTADNVPLSWDFTTDLATTFDYTASDGIESLALGGTISVTNGSISATAVSLIAVGLPDAANFVMEPSEGATLTMSGPANLISFGLSSDEAIFNSDYQLIEGTLEDIPAQWLVNWAEDDFTLETLDAEDNPYPLGHISALLSTSSDPDENAARIEPFTLDGPVLEGPVLEGTSGGCRIEYTEFQQEIDKRYYDAGGAPNVYPRLQNLYCDSEELDLGEDPEDHVVVRMDEDTVEFASIQFSGFQMVAIEPAEDGGHYQFKAPSADAHPFFGGFEDAENNDEFTTLQIESLPQEIELTVDTEIQITEERVGGAVTGTTDGPAGKIDLYSGPLPMAENNAEALRATLDETPESVIIWWVLDIHGGATFDVSAPFEVRLLAQDDGQRVVAAADLGDLVADWGITLLNEQQDLTDPACIISLVPPLPWPVCGVAILKHVEVFFDFTAEPGLDGIVNVYEWTGSPHALSPGGPDPSEDGEYVPQLTFALKDFDEYEATGFIGQCIPPLCWPPEGNLAIGVGVDLGTKYFDKFTFDYWDQGGDPAVIVGDADYITNEPWHIAFPLLHDFSDHFDPFDP
jgi:hypothetical protein